MWRVSRLPRISFRSPHAAPLPSLPSPQRCANVPLFGRPRAVATVDKYQGQQNDFVLLSLVRTKSVGHLRDVRRLVVAVRVPVRYPLCVKQ